MTALKFDNLTKKTTTTKKTGIYTGKSTSEAVICCLLRCVVVYLVVDYIQGAVVLWY